MPSPVVPNIIRVRAWMKDGAQAAVNTSYWRVIGVVVPGATLDEIATSFDATLAPLYKPLLANTARYQGLGLAVIAPFGTMLADLYHTTSAGNGTGGAIGLPKQTSGLFSYYDGYAGRKHRGRNYVPFPAAADNADPGVPAAGYLVKLNALAAVFTTNQIVVGAFGTTTLEPIIYHKASGLGDTITSSIARTVWATMKKRGDYGRANSSPI